MRAHRRAEHPTGTSIAFNFFRLAAIIQGVKKRALDGNGSNPERGLKMGEMVPVLAELGLEIARGSRLKHRFPRHARHSGPGLLAGQA